MSDDTLIISYLEQINTRTIENSKEINELKYLMQNKKLNTVTTATDSTDSNKMYITKQKMYLQKLNNNIIKLPKAETLKFYNIDFIDDIYKIKNII